MPEYRVFVRDSARMIQAEVEQFESIDVVLRFNAPDSWVLEGVPLDSIAGQILAGLDDGADGMIGLVLERDGEIIMNGPCDASTPIDSVDGLTVNANGYGDLIWLQRQVAHPSPTDLSYATQSHDERSGSAESLLHAYVNANRGPDAAASEQVPGLTMGTDSNRGTVMTKRARLENLLDWCQQIAALDGLGFRIRQSDTDLIFETYQPRDLRSQTVFTRELGNISAISFPHQTASINQVIVGGSGEGTARIFALRSDPESIARYGKRTVFVDQRQSSSATELGQTIANQLESGKGGSGAEIAVLDTDAIQFGRDYDTGDLVSAESQGRVIFAYVTEIAIHIDERGDQVTPRLSPAAVAPVPRGQVAMREAIRQLSANAEGPTIGEQKRWPRPLAEKPSGWQLADGTNGTTDTIGLFGKGAADDSELGDTGGSSSANLQHNHSGAPHTHSHAHTGPVHTHSHAHTGAPHTHSHDHFGGLHTHNVNIDHNHPVTLSSGIEDPSDLDTDTISNPTDALRDYVGEHQHNVDIAALGPTPIISDGGGSATAPTDVDATAASFSGNTGTDATAASSANTGSDATAATFSGNTGNALSSVSIDPVHVKIYYLERVA